MTLNGLVKSSYLHSMQSIEAEQSYMNILRARGIECQFFTLLIYNTLLDNLWTLVFAMHVSFLLPDLTPPPPILFQSYLLMYQYQFTNCWSSSSFSSNICRSGVKQAYNPYSAAKFLHILRDLYSSPGGSRFHLPFTSRICFFQPHSDPYLPPFPWFTHISSYWLLDIPLLQKIFSFFMS